MSAGARSLSASVADARPSTSTDSTCRHRTQMRRADAFRKMVAPLRRFAGRCARDHGVVHNDFRSASQVVGTARRAAAICDRHRHAPAVAGRSTRAVAKRIRGTSLRGPDHAVLVPSDRRRWLIRFPVRGRHAPRSVSRWGTTHLVSTAVRASGDRRSSSESTFRHGRELARCRPPARPDGGVVVLGAARVVGTRPARGRSGEQVVRSRRDQFGEAPGRQYRVIR